MQMYSLYREDRNREIYIYIYIHYSLKSPFEYYHSKALDTSSWLKWHPLTHTQTHSLALENGDMKFRGTHSEIKGVLKKHA